VLMRGAARGLISCSTPTCSSARTPRRRR
jgi:hypothetical protein